MKTIENVWTVVNYSGVAMALVLIIKGVFDVYQKRNDDAVLELVAGFGTFNATMLKMVLEILCKKQEA